MKRTLYYETKTRGRLVGQAVLVLLALAGTGLTQTSDPFDSDDPAPVRPVTYGTAGNPPAAANPQATGYAPVAGPYPDPVTAGQRIHFEVIVATAPDRVFVDWAARHKADIKRVEVPRDSRQAEEPTSVSSSDPPKPSTFASMFGSEVAVPLLFDAEIRKSLMDRLQNDERANILQNPSASTQWHQSTTVPAGTKRNGQRPLRITLKPTPIGKGELSLEISTELAEGLRLPAPTKRNWRWNLRAQSNHTLLIPVTMLNPDERLVLLVQPQIIARNPTALTASPQAILPRGPYAAQTPQTTVPTAQQLRPVVAQPQIARAEELVQITANLLITKAEFIPDQPVELNRKQLEASMQQVNADSATINHQLRSAVKYGDEARLTPPYPVGEKTPFELRITPERFADRITLDLHATISSVLPNETELKTKISTEPNITTVLPLPIVLADGRKVALLLQPSPMPVAIPIRARPTEYADPITRDSVETVAQFQMLVLEADSKIVAKVLAETRTTDEKLSSVDVQRPRKSDTKKRTSKKLKTQLRTFLMNGTTSKLFVADLRKQDESFRVIARPQVRTLIDVSAAMSIHGGPSPSEPKAGVGKLDIHVRPKKSGDEFLAETTLKFTGPGTTIEPGEWTPGLSFEVFASQKCTPGQSAVMVVGGQESERATILLTDLVTIEEVAIAPARSLAVGTPIPLAGVPVWRKADPKTATISGFQFRGVAPQRPEKTDMRLLRLQVLRNVDVVAGDVVDVLLFRNGGSSVGTKIETLFESLTVYESSKAHSSGGGSPPVTLLVNKELVTKLLTAGSQPGCVLSLSVHRAAVPNSTASGLAPVTPQPQYPGYQNVMADQVTPVSRLPQIPGYRPTQRAVYPDAATWNVPPPNTIISASDVRKPHNDIQAPSSTPMPRPRSEVQQVLDEVREMRKLIQGLREDMNALRDSASDAPQQRTSRQADVLHPVGQADAARRQIDEALNADVSIEIEDGTIEDALQQLHKAAGVNIVIDVQAFEEEGISTDSRVSLHVSGVSLRSALKILLSPFHLTTLIEDEVLKVTSEQAAEGKQIVAAYQVKDLLQTDTGGTPDFDSLIELITTVVEPDSWQDVGGPGAVAASPATTSLVVRQTQAAHEEIQRLFTTLRNLVSTDATGTSANVTNPLQRETGMGVLVYSVGHLFTHPDVIDLKTLQDVITSSVDPDSWQVAGGEGTIARNEKTQTLVIRQTGATHKEITDLLAQLGALEISPGDVFLSQPPAFSNQATPAGDLSEKPAENTGTSITRPRRR